MTFIVATNVIASRPPERRLTGTPHARAKRMAFLVATTSLPAVYHPNGYARTTTAGTPHARSNEAITIEASQITNEVLYQSKTI